MREKLPDDLLGHLYRIRVPWSGLDIDIEVSSKDLATDMATSVVSTVEVAETYAALLLGDESDVIEPGTTQETAWELERPRRDLVSPEIPSGETSPIEAEILLLVRQGLPIDEIANRMGISEDVARRTIRAIRRRLSNDQRAVMASLGYKRGRPGQR
jgi:DNA-binding NarL/FixJ family response regulator